MAGGVGHDPHPYAMPPTRSGYGLGKEAVLFRRKEPKDFSNCARGNVEAMADTTGIASRARVFWFFSSEKNCFLSPCFC
jgi:hypothetical protein